MSGAELTQRLAAILAADAAGYSRLMAGAERATIAALDSARAVFKAHIEANQGRVVDMAGDSVLAIFQTATGAVLSARAIQQALDGLVADVPDEQRLRFRIGIHLGDVIEKADGSVYGDGVNIAARLQALAEPGGISVSELIRSAVQGRVTATFEDQGEQWVKNIPEAVRTFRVKPADGASSKPNRAMGPPELSLPDKPSIAVLPFANISGDAEQEFFTDGIVEDIITELSRFRSLFVIARNSSFTYKGHAVDVRTVAKELGVRYVVEGSIRRAGQRVRVTAQLIDALTGSHLWAEKYDRELMDVFAVQEELTRRVVMAIAPEIEATEIARATRVRPENLTAYELGLRAAAASLNAFRTADTATREAAKSLANDALRVDPRCVGALNALVATHSQEVIFRKSPDARASYQHCVAASERAFEVDRSAHQSLCWRGLVEVLSASTSLKAAGLGRLRQAVEINPNDAASIAALAYGETVSGDHQRGKELALSALRLSPRDPMRCWFANTLALASVLAKDYGAGIEWARSAIADAPSLLVAHEQAVLAYAGLGRFEEARQEVDLIRRAAPEQCAMLLERGMLYLSDPEHRARATLFFRIAAGLEVEDAAKRYAGGTQ